MLTCSRQPCPARRRVLLQGKAALLAQQGDGGMVYGHILSYKADVALQLDFLRALSANL